MTESPIAPLVDANSGSVPPSRGSSRRWIISGVIVAVLGLLVFLQVRAWQHFDWKTFWFETRDVRWSMVAAASAMILGAYCVRTLRWKVFLRAVRPTPYADLLPPTLIGFTGLALLGRPGEFVRPVLIAQKTGTSVAQQVGIWTIERIFDMGGYGLIAAVAMLLSKSLPNPNLLRAAGAAFVAVMLVLCVAAFAIHRAGSAMFTRLEARYAHAPRFVRAVLSKAHGFLDGLNTIQDASAFIQIALLSSGMWLMICTSYFLVARAYPSLGWIPFTSMALVVGFSMVGGLVQLPAVGGGAQIATILAMANVFAVPREVAVSCGILIWIVSFWTAVPFGLLLARKRHLSFRRMSHLDSQTPA